MINSPKIKTGYVSILGLPNSGKSTLMNSLIGQKLSITTNKPQTTRKRILGILSEKDYQVIFLDNPGILKPGYLLRYRNSRRPARFPKSVCRPNRPPHGSSIPPEGRRSRARTGGIVRQSERRYRRGNGQRAQRIGKKCLPR